MPRLKVIDPDNATGKAKELFEGPLKGKEINIFRGMANSPATLAAYVGIGKALSEDGLLSGKERETIALSVSQDNNCGYCLAAHTYLGKSEGLTEEETLGARKGRLDDAKLNALARFAKALNEKKGFVNEKDLQDIRSAGYEDGHIAEAVLVYAQTLLTNYFNHVNETEVDFPEPPSLN